jgi:hypothetical protein
MRSVLLLLACFLCVMPTTAGAFQSSETSAEQARSAQKTPQESCGQVARGEDLQALREDLTRMKALVQQMQSNLAFVDTTQSPLKHQFQLEIDMWQTLITQMERRLAQTRQSAP